MKLLNEIHVFKDEHKDALLFTAILGFCTGLVFIGLGWILWAIR